MVIEGLCLPRWRGSQDRLRPQRQSTVPGHSSRPVTPLRRLLEARSSAEASALYSRRENRSFAQWLAWAAQSSPFPGKSFFCLRRSSSAGKSPPMGLRQRKGASDAVVWPGIRLPVFCRAALARSSATARGDVSVLAGAVFRSTTFRRGTDDSMPCNLVERAAVVLGAAPDSAVFVAPASCASTSSRGPKRSISPLCSTSALSSAASALTGER